jgi:plastocyanin
VTRKTTIAATVAALTLVLVASACGGGSSSAGGETTTTEATSTTEAMTTTEGGSGSATGTLEGETGPGFEIEVKQHGEDAESVKAGTYTLKVEDKSDIHNFHLIGPGVDQEVTSVPFEGEKTVTVTLEPGTYTYQCDPHASQGMKGTFEVT